MGNLHAQFECDGRGQKPLLFVKTGRENQIKIECNYQVALCVCVCAPQDICDKLTKHIPRKVNKIKAIYQVLGSKSTPFLGCKADLPADCVFCCYSTGEPADFILAGSGFSVYTIVECYRISVA